MPMYENIGFVNIDNKSEILLLMFSGWFEMSSI